MKFWTAYQEPFRQAAKVEEGKVTQLIPDHPPQTVARWVACVGEHKGDLLVGKKAAIERYKMDGSEFIDSIYHPWIFGLHAVGSYNGLILVVSAGLDVCFLMDERGAEKWSWWAYKDGFCPEPVIVKDPSWPAVQATAPYYEPMKTSSHLNSGNPDKNGIMVTLMRSKKVLFLDTNVSDPKSREIMSGLDAMHDFKYDYRGPKPILVGGVSDGVFIDGKVYTLHDPPVRKSPYGDALVKWRSMYGFVKRVNLYENDKYLVTYESGVAVMDRSGKILSNIALPRPFNTVVF